MELIDVVAHTVLHGWMLSGPGDLVTFRLFNLANNLFTIGSLNDDWEGLGCELCGS